MLRLTGKWMILLLAFAILYGPSAQGAGHDTSRVKTLFVLGDSLSDGFQLRRSEAYPALLFDKLRRQGWNYKVINASQSGGTSEEGLRRLPPHLRGKIDIFILELGINDAFQAVPISETRRNLQDIIERVKERNPTVRVLIAGMQILQSSAGDNVSAFTKMYADLAGDPLLNLPDRLHPNAAGQKVLAENVWRVLEPIARGVATMPVPAHLP